ncbi:hypothetical protein Plhal304r1_c011g0043931 [Plasmopara halstedii]
MNALRGIVKSQYAYGKLGELRDLLLLVEIGDRDPALSVKIFLLALKICKSV